MELGDGAAHEHHFERQGETAKADHKPHREEVGGPSSTQMKSCFTSSSGGWLCFIGQRGFGACYCPKSPKWIRSAATPEMIRCWTVWTSLQKLDLLLDMLRTEHLGCDPYILSWEKTPLTWIYFCVDILRIGLLIYNLQCRTWQK